MEAAPESTSEPAPIEEPAQINHGRSPALDSFGCRIREVLERVADKWSLYVVATLGDGPLRFTELKRNVDGISQRMLTVTLRNLERDGIVLRTVRSVMPPHVCYELTDMGTSLLEATDPLISWSNKHLARIDAARAEFDERTGVETRNRA